MSAACFGCGDLGAEREIDLEIPERRVVVRCCNDCADAYAEIIEEERSKK